MNSMASHILLFTSLLLLLTISTANQEKEFLQCIYTHSSSQFSKSFKLIHPQHSQSYSNLLQSAEKNPRWLNSTSLKPRFIITPHNADEMRATIICSRKHGLQIRVKSGGHDYEGLSYLCKTPFVIIDLINLRSIRIDLEEETGWVEAGATLGELYYTIARKSSVHGFPAGICPSVGVGGHFSGGGLGSMVRKHGLAADNIIDAHFMDANGELLDRKSMGEDLFWAIRGGGGASFGVVLAWKISLVRVPPVLTVFNLYKVLNDEGIKLVMKWQNVAHKLPENIMIRVILSKSEALFNTLFLGPVSELLPLMKTRFPELGLHEKDCTETSWIGSVLYFAGFGQDGPLEVLLNRTIQAKSYFKAKSDFVQKPMPETAYQEIRRRLTQEEKAYVIMDPFGAKMDEIPGPETPFPHRKGNLFNIQYLVYWNEENEWKIHVEWIRMVYEYMKTYVSDSPRAAYLNYRDLDLGRNMEANTSYEQALIWGAKYFKGNFKRLAMVKKVVDPMNFFRFEQSIPLFSSSL